MRPGVSSRTDPCRQHGDKASAWSPPVRQLVLRSRSEAKAPKLCCSLITPSTPRIPCAAENRRGEARTPFWPRDVYVRGGDKSTGDNDDDVRVPKDGITTNCKQGNLDTRKTTTTKGRRVFSRCFFTFFYIARIVSWCHVPCAAITHVRKK